MVVDVKPWNLINQAVGRMEENIPSVSVPETVPRNEPEMDMFPNNKVLDILREDPQTPIACQVETKQSQTYFEMQPRQSSVNRDQLVYIVDPDELFSCEMAWRMAEFLKE
ncbi:hypothetical protein DPEC_G00138100 [Dallia pectoralis]|uniref:Uncharacterized protein n=1 Tax=Dallia pectoralis TaxID=75939 RepID=A0ACC2GMD4_DALPE|nr:hypothetical protein DPEC_G00138100 [Dallia pectoralis]